MRFGSKGIQVNKYTLEVLILGLFVFVGAWFLNFKYGFPEEFAYIFYIVGFILIIFSTLTILRNLFRKW